MYLSYLQQKKEIEEIGSCRDNKASYFHLILVVTSGIYFFSQNWLPLTEIPGLKEVPMAAPDPDTELN